MPLVTSETNIISGFQELVVSKKIFCCRWFSEILQTTLFDEEFCSDVNGDVIGFCKWSRHVD